MSQPHTVRWTVGRKLALGFGTTLVFLAAVAGFGLYGMATIDGRLTQIVEVNNLEARLTVAMRASVYQVSNLSRNIVLLGDDLAQLRAEQEKLKVARDSYEAAEKDLAALLAVTATDEQKSLFGRIQAVKEQVRPLNVRVIELAAKSETVDATSLLMTRVAGPQADWLNLLAELAAMEDKRTDEAAAAAQSAYRAIRVQMLLLAGLALLVAGGFAWFITRGLSRQLGGEPGYAAEVASQIASGNLSVPVHLQPGDQGSLLHAMSRMQASLVQVVGSIRAGADSIATGSSQIATGNADLSQRTEEQASNLQQTAASMSQLTTSVQHNADTARQAAELVVHASRCANDGNQAVHQVQGAMAGIESASARIGEIIGVIDGIAFQTNILALNAAVEAARAGEQGRGFAVVAGEVRSLAKRSAEAARQVKQLIVDSGEKVAAGSGHVASAARTMDEILASVKRVNDLMGDIDAGSSQQSQGIGQVSQAVAQLDQVTQQNAALVEQSAAAAESLRHQADALVRGVSVFQLSSQA